MSASRPGVPNAASGSTSTGKKAFPPVDLEGNDLPPSPAPSSPHPGRRYNIATELVFTEGSDQYNASSVPIYQVHIPQQPNGKFNGILMLTMINL
jgi:cystathionine beta-lyase